MKPPICLIVEAAADVFDTTTKDILGKARFRPIVRARHAACKVAREEGWATTTIGRHFGHCDHTTATYACKQFEILFERDPEFALRADKLRLRARSLRGQPLLKGGMRCH